VEEPGGRAAEDLAIAGAGVSAGAAEAGTGGLDLWAGIERRKKRG